jgi:hypothetical protein
MYTMPMLNTQATIEAHICFGRFILFQSGPLKFSEIQIRFVINLNLKNVHITEYFFMAAIEVISVLLRMHTSRRL